MMQVMIHEVDVHKLEITPHFYDTKSGTVFSGICTNITLNLKDLPDTWTGGLFVHLNATKHLDIFLSFIFSGKIWTVTS